MKQFYVKMERSSPQAAEFIIEAESESVLKKALPDIIEMVGKGNGLIEKWFSTGVPSKPKVKVIDADKKIVVPGKLKTDIKIDKDKILIPGVKSD